MFERTVSGVTSRRSPSNPSAVAPQPSGSAPPLEARAVSRVIGDKAIVNNVTITLHPGEIVALSGASGAGKSSFLRLLNRLDESTGGDVLVDGINYRQLKPSELRRRVGMVMQAAHLFPGTVNDNIQFGPRQQNLSVSRADVEALLERIGLPGYADRDVQNLSGGEAQRVSIARTLVNNPSTLLLDEPTSALDENAAREIEALVMGLVEERQMACLIITHNMPQALRIAPKAMVLAAGALVAVGATEEVLHAR
ncbi:MULTISPECIES: ATP-binding cassette domain-containing protein [unclassified Beijerinckia]|uniref:ABC transporter ATP-binding protein n=1 Tax=unclassified Beijerinckia TaxID=2638183 RepID=UPI0008995046|nr:MULTISPECIES: ATP-binding cassette domain-containing protein [unclassified Beijerinckia]MDH7799458.1 putative ABC transport system ATP-binding protein [Beijerinckia sp. GAS462]SED51153.1 putative ABC transport system ATP-binding protein [Beijerinckia sp. 28-YEA-48]